MTVCWNSPERPGSARLPRGAQHIEDHLGQPERIDRMRYGGLGPRPCGQPRVLRAADQHYDRRTVKNLVFDLARDAHPPGGGCFTVENSQIDITVVEALDHRRLSGTFGVFEAGQVWMRRRA